MALTDNDRIQEIALITGDAVSKVGKKLWYALGITLVAFIPAYFLFKFVFVQIFMQSYEAPEIIYTEVAKQPLQVIEKKIFTLPNNTYSGFIKIKNIELEWGVAAQPYTVEYKTFGGTVVSRLSRSTFILAAKEKIIVLPRFSSDQKPDEIVITLGETRFTHKPEIEFNPDLERVTLSNPSSGMLVSAGIKNNTAFTLTQIDLPVVVYDNNNEVIAVNFTYINDVLSGETRTFQYTWPQGIPGATRAEITPEINVFDPNILKAPDPISPF